MVFPVSAVSVIAVLALFLVSQSAAHAAGVDETIHSEPFRPRSGESPATPGRPLFTRLGPESTRLSFINRIAAWHEQKRLYLSSFAAGSVAIGDLDGDGLSDIFVAGGAEDNRLYLQADNLTFLDITAGLPIEGAGRWSAGAAIVDIDNDGDNDLYVCHYDQPNQLFINQTKENGKLSFSEEAGRFKLDIADASLLPAFADFDLDGDLDLFLLTHRLLREGGRPATAPPVEQSGKSGPLTISGDLGRYYAVADKPDAAGKWVYWEQGRPDRLLRNDKGVFKDVTATAGISSAPASGNSALWWDYDEDGYPDLFVGNEDAPSQLYRNTGKGTFKETTTDVFPPLARVARGSALLDTNGDSRPDLMLASVLGTTHYQRQSAAEPVTDHNQLFLSTGASRFLEAGWISGLACTGHSWSVKTGDYDLDGREDLFVTNGCARHVRHGDLPKVGHEQLVGRTAWDNYESTAPELREANRAFRGTGKFPFEDVSARWGLNLVGMSYTCAQGDLDNDGDLDLVVAGLEDPLFVFRNDVAAGNAVRVRLRGSASNRGGLGAKVYLTTSGGRKVRQISGPHGYLSADAPEAHFGLGDQQSVALLQVQWPGGVLQEFKDLPVNQLYTITEPPRKSVVQPSLPAKPVPMFVEREPLGAPQDDIPAAPRVAPTKPQMFQEFSFPHLGPGQAWGDADGDGRPDLYLGARAGHPGRLFLNHSIVGGKPSFSRSGQRLFATHEEREDTAAVFFDANGDGALDLYVGSGATGQEEGASTLRDRLYLNSGSGIFDDASYRLPDLRENTSTVCVSDFDRDGDQDLFVGYRCQFGRYPYPSGGRLLLNEGKEFRDATAQSGPSLAAAGRISSSLWSDLDTDGWPDLVLALDHGPIQIHMNLKGKLGAPSTYSGLQDLSGQWNAVAAADLDQDGDMDLVGANAGLNNPFSASTAAPKVIFAGEWEGEGKVAVLEAYQEQGVWYPERSLGFWRQALPSIFPEKMSHHAFGSASIDRLFGLDHLRKAMILKATEARSGAFYNDGSGRFAFVPFPLEAQVAPAFGIALADFDLDGRTDVYLAQNASGSEHGQTPSRGGLGVLLHGSARPASPAQRFVMMSPGESGIVLSGDGRSAAAVDVNRDGLPDLVTGMLEGNASVLMNQRKPAYPALAVVLRGPPGNLNAAGARLTLEAKGLPRQVVEVRSGEGFLSSTTGEQILACPQIAGSEPVLKVVWSDGTVTERLVPLNSFLLEVAYPPPAAEPTPPPTAP